MSDLLDSEAPVAYVNDGDARGTTNGHASALDPSKGGAVGRSGSDSPPHSTDEEEEEGGEGGGSPDGPPFLERPRRRHSFSSVQSSCHEGSPNDMHFLVQELRRCLSELRRDRLPSPPSLCHSPPSSSPSSSAVRELKPLTNRDLESWATLIFESMSAPSRSFHSVQHVFDISDGSKDAVHVVAAFFHDVVYYNIDGGLSPDQAVLLDGVVQEEFDDGHDRRGGYGNGGAATTVRVSESIAEDRLMGMAMTIFGFEPGQVLNPFSGLNEFLSACLAVRCLKGVVDDGHLASVAACIEGTIPFRRPKNGTSPMEALHSNLVAANGSYDLGLTPDRMVEVVRTTVRLANRDVGNFATTDYAFFLASTWDLLPESNIDLRVSVYRCASFTMALKKMLGFLSNLDPGVIYYSFRGEPSRETLLDLYERSTTNLSIAVKYLQLKVLGLSVVAALAELTGGDAPLLMFVRGLTVINDAEDFDDTDTEEDSEGSDVVVSGEGGDAPPVDRKPSPASGGGGRLPPHAMSAVNFSGVVLPPVDDDSNPRRASAPVRGNRRQSFIQNFGIVSRKQTDDLHKDPIVYSLLKEGRNDSSKFDVANSPLSAYLYGLIGDGGLQRSLVYCVCPMDEENSWKLLDSLPAEGVRIIAKSCANLVVTRTEELRAIARRYSRKAKSESRRNIFQG